MKYLKLEGGVRERAVTLGFWFFCLLSISITTNITAYYYPRYYRGVILFWSLSICSTIVIAVIINVVFLFCKFFKKYILKQNTHLSEPLNNIIKLIILVFILMLVAPSGSPQLFSQSFYSMGVGSYEGGNYKSALMNFHRCIDILPGGKFAKKCEEFIKKMNKKSSSKH